MGLHRFLEDFLFEGLKLIDFGIDGCYFLLDGLGVRWWVKQEAWHLTGLFLSNFGLNGRSVTLIDDVLHWVGCLNFEMILRHIYRFRIEL